MSFRRHAGTFFHERTSEPHSCQLQPMLAACENALRNLIDGNPLSAGYAERVRKSFDSTEHLNNNLTELHLHGNLFTFSSLCAASCVQQMGASALVEEFWVAVYFFVARGTQPRNHQDTRSLSLMINIMTLPQEPPFSRPFQCGLCIFEDGRCCL